MSTTRKASEQQSTFTRQATILRKNLLEWDSKLRNTRDEDWPAMLGRQSAALNQTANLDRSIDDVMEHFVYLPKKATANPQDIPFFLSTRLESSATTVASDSSVKASTLPPIEGDAVQLLAIYENMAARLATDYEENIIRF